MLTVSDVLALPVLRRGLPEVIAGEQHLERPVRWAHIIDLAEVSGLLKGGEFVLNNGFGVGPDAHTQRAFIRELAEQDVSAVAVELGLVFQSALPAPMTAEARRLKLPLIALHRKTRFVEVTEAIHQRLMGEELIELRRTDELTQQLTEAMLAGSGVPELLGLAARLLGNPLVLEDASQRLVAVAPAQSDETIVVRMWRDVLDAEARDHDSSRGALDTPVRITKGPWGRLVALDLDGSFDDLAPALVERVASSIAMRLVTQQQVEELGARSRGALIDELVAGRLGEQEATRRAAALGFVRESRTLLPLALAWRGSEAAEAVSWVAVSAELRSALARVGMNALIGPHADRLMLVVDPGREGAHTVASMVVFEGGAPKKSDYRRFGIRDAVQDDFAAMAEVLSRRMAQYVAQRERSPHEKDYDDSFASLPALIVIDGGRGQLSAGLKELGPFRDLGVTVVSLAKRIEEVFTPGSSAPLRLAHDTPELQLLQRARDEAHRFAIEFHRGRRDKAMTRSVLDDLPGVGPARKRSILQHFGSPERFLSASREELESVPGLPQKVARDIHAYVNKIR